MDRIGVIYEIDDKRAVVLTADSKFVIVKSRPDMNIGQQIIVKEEHIINPKGNIFLYTAAISGIAAIFVIAFLYFNFFIMSNQTGAYGYVSVDINPSIELEIDREYKVVKLNPLNEDAKPLILDLNSKDRVVEEVITDLIDKSLEMGFIAQNAKNPVLVSGTLKKANIAKEEEAKLGELLKNIKASMENKDIKGYIMLTTDQEREIAQSEGISMGRYSLYTRAQKISDNSVFDDAHKMDIAEVIDSLDELEIRVIFDDVWNSKLIAQANAKGADKQVLEPTGFLPSVLLPTPTPEATGVANVTAMPEDTPKGDVTDVKETKLKIQHFNKPGEEKSKGVDFSFRMLNTGSKAINLKNIKVRYYFKDTDSTSALNSAIYFYSYGDKEAVGCKFYDLKGSKDADKYLELTFDAESFPPDGELYVMGMFHKNDWDEFQLDDNYSYNPANTYMDWSNMTIYISDILVWGKEP